MTHRAVVPEELEHYYRDWHMSPGLVCGDFIFMTGVTGTDSKGNVADDPETQIRSAFHKVGLILEKAGLTYGALVEFTSYHVGLRDHLDLFKRIRAEFIVEPYPAWTAIEVSGFATEGVIVEIKAIASRQSRTH